MQHYVLQNSITTARYENRTNDYDLQLRGQLHYVG